MNNPVKTCLAIMLAAMMLFGSGFRDEAGAATAEEINVRSDATLKQFYEQVGGGKKLVDSAEGVLIFPSIVKAGFFVGGEYGEGALRIDGKTVEYYNTAAGSFGFQLGVQSKALILIFLEKQALDNFRNSSGWKVGVDGSVALIEIGAGGAIDTTNIKDPIVGFALTNQGLMFNLTLEGSKFTKIVR